ncbi:MAG: nuclear transport factor 2 family protein, partial [Pseudomonadota bacterium]|nr:nuclear transport factor 2 family protein [Pseudomonadota bacterium]
MLNFTLRARTFGLGVVAAICCLAITPAGASQSPAITAQTLIDRAQIQDLITRYYNNFGREDAENFADFYADDAELILGT